MSASSSPGFLSSMTTSGNPLTNSITSGRRVSLVPCTLNWLAARKSLAATSATWRLAQGRDADDDLYVLGYWLTSQAPPAMQTCHHLHGGMGVDITYPMTRYYTTIKDLTRWLGGPSHRLDLVGIASAAEPGAAGRHPDNRVGAQCSSN